MTNVKVMEIFDSVRKFVNSTQAVVVPRAGIKNDLGEGYTLSEIDNAISVLQLDDLISLSFSDAEFYCIALTAKGVREGELRDEAKRLVEEKERLSREAAAVKAESVIPTLTPETPPAHPEEEEVSLINKRGFFSWSDFKKLAVICAAGSFLGSLLAGIITMIVVLVKVG